MENINHFLTVYNSPWELKRLGPSYDGGYIVPLELLSETKNLISLGVGDVTEFEDFLYEYDNNVKFFLYDHTIEEPPYISNHFDKYSYFKKGVGANSEGNILSFKDIFESLNIEKATVKMDIEECEYSVLPSMTEYFSKIPVLILELHKVGPRYKEAIELLKLLQKDFYLVHKHLSDWEETFSVDDFCFVNEYELTFVNKSCFETEPEVSTAVFPIKGLDFPNTLQLRENCIVDWPNYKENLRKAFDRNGRKTVTKSTSKNLTFIERENLV